MACVVYKSVAASGSFNRVRGGVGTQSPLVLSINQSIVESFILQECLIYHFPVTTSSGGLGDSQWKSPFDTCPSTTSPVSLSNLQVSVGDQNVLQSTLQNVRNHFLRTSQSLLAINLW